MLNYLKERIRGRVAEDAERQRGQNFTSLDFGFRFRRSDGLIQIVAGEWKYTERYANGRRKSLMVKRRLAARKRLQDSIAHSREEESIRRAHPDRERLVHSGPRSNFSMGSSA